MMRRYRKRYLPESHIVWFPDSLRVVDGVLKGTFYPPAKAEGSTRHPEAADRADEDSGTTAV
ncbi:MAG: hypothetical protein ACE5JQ_00680 [Candidatus Methylomirabilales bacterium]